MSITFLLDEKPTVVPVASGGERSAGIRPAIKNADNVASRRS